MLERLTSREPANQIALVFVHGFTGDRAGTWGRIPEHAGPALPGWDLFGFGYESHRRFDIPNLWSSDARLEEISTKLFAAVEHLPHPRLAFVAHSMGGLVAQRALVRYEALRKRTSHLCMFGTPSAGLVKASLLAWFKQQVNNMSASGPFIRDLRKAWDDLQLSSGSPFQLLAVAGESDQFVPPKSSLEPFPEEARRVIEGNHVSMLLADSTDSPCVQVLVNFLTQGAGARAAGLIVESGRFAETIERLWTTRLELDDQAAVELAIALRVHNRLNDAVEYLEAFQPNAAGADPAGVLAGLYKRRWYQERRRADAEAALRNYRGAYDRAVGGRNSGQAYYLGINVAFMELAYGQDYQAARQYAEQVLQHTAAAGNPRNELWQPATEGDALLMLGRTDEAFERHTVAAALTRNPWQAVSAQDQLIRTAELCGLTKDRTEEFADLYETALSGEALAAGSAH
jgi:pimeloyl-ACP methyl ester carboxylesterase